jgi:hypothetical protein
VNKKDALQKKFRIPSDQLSGVWARVVKSINGLSRAKKQQNTKGEKIDILLTRIDRVIVTASASNLDQAIEDMIKIRQEMETFRPTQYSDSESSSDEAES